MPGPGGAMPQPSRMTSATRGYAPRLAYRLERLDLERGAADERAVDVGLRQQLGGVVGLDRAAVETGASRSDLMNACASCAISGVAVSPVPIAQTGS